MRQPKTLVIHRVITIAVAASLIGLSPMIYDFVPIDPGVILNRRSRSNVEPSPSRLTLSVERRLERLFSSLRVTFDLLAASVVR